MYETSLTLGIRPRSLAGILFVPLILAILIAGVCQSITGEQIVWSAGGPLTLLLELARLCYGVTAAIFAIHGFIDYFQGYMTRLHWLPGSMDDLEDDEPTIEEDIAWLIFPNHLDGAVLAGGLSLASSLALALMA
jgi:hypothetical protein